MPSTVPVCSCKQHIDSQPLTCCKEALKEGAISQPTRAAEHDTVMWGEEGAWGQTGWGERTAEMVAVPVATR